MRRGPYQRLARTWSRLLSCAWRRLLHLASDHFKGGIACQQNRSPLPGEEQNGKGSRPAPISDRTVRCHAKEQTHSYCPEYMSPPVTHAARFTPSDEEAMENHCLAPASKRSVHVAPPSAEVKMSPNAQAARRDPSDEEATEYHYLAPAAVRSVHVAPPPASRVRV